MRTRVACIAAAVVAVVLLVGACTSGDSSGQRDSLRVGVIAPLTGRWATYGMATQRGVDLALEEINAKGGVDGKMLVARYEDSKGEPREALSALQKLADVEGVPVVLGAFRSAETMAIAPYAEEQGIVLFSASSTADDIRDAGDYIFRNVPTNDQQGTVAAHFILEHLEESRAAVLYQNDDYGKSLADAFQEEYSRLGGEVVAVETFEGGQADFRQVLLKIGRSNPGIVFFPGNYQECARILKQAREQRMAAEFVGGDGAYSPELIDIAAEAAEGAYFTLMAMGYGISDEEISRFEAAFNDAFSVEPDVYAAYAYDAVGMIAAAMEAGGYSADGIRDALYGMTYKGVTGITRFDSLGEVDKPFYVYEVAGGGFELIAWTPESQSPDE